MLGGLKDKIAKALALKWIRGKAAAGRKEGNPVLKYLDGNKRTVLAIGFVISGLVALITGHDVSQWMDLILKASGWSDQATIDAAKAVATAAVPLLWAMWASFDGLRKLLKQWLACAKPIELGSTAGVIKAAMADGSLGPIMRKAEDEVIFPADKG